MHSTLIHVPHAGTLIPSRLGYVVGESRIAVEVDLLTDHLTDVIFDIPHLERIVCPWSRVFCDVERLLDGEPMEASGMGFFYTTCDDGTPLRQDRDGAKQVARQYYQAHHEALRVAVEARVRQNGFCHLIDAHSFPDVPLRRDLDRGADRPDVCLGITPNNTPGHVVDRLKTVFSRAGLSVAVDRPYAGSMLIPGHTSRTLTSVMVELNRRLYDDRSRIPRLTELLWEAFLTP